MNDTQKEIEAESVSTTSTTTGTTIRVEREIEIRHGDHVKEDHNYCVVKVVESVSGVRTSQNGSRKSDSSEKQFLYVRKRVKNNFSVKKCRAKYKKKIGCVEENIKKIEGDNIQLKQAIFRSKFELKFWKKLHQIVAESQEPGTASKILENLTKDSVKVSTLMKQAASLLPTPMTKLHHQRQPRRRSISHEKCFENQDQEEEVTQPRTDMGIEKGGEEQEPAPAAVAPESESEPQPQEQQELILELVEQAEQLSLSLQVPEPAPAPSQYENSQTETQTSQTIVINIRYTIN